MNNEDKELVENLRLALALAIGGRVAAPVDTIEESVRTLTRLSTENAALRDKRDELLTGLHIACGQISRMALPENVSREDVLSYIKTHRATLKGQD